MLFDLKRREDRYLLFIASFLFLLWLIDFLTKIIFSTYTDVFWFCSLSLLIASIVIFTRNATLLVGFLSVSIALQGIWLIDILSLVFMGKDIFGTSFYLFLPNISEMEVYTTMKHFFMIPLEFFAFLFMKKLPRKFFNVILATFLFTLGFLLISLIFGSELNINYVYYPTFDLGFTLNNYAEFFFIYLGFIVISGSLIAYILYEIFGRYKELFYIKHIRTYFWIVFILCFILALKVSLFVFNTRKNTGI